jgi:hypothetical protein
VEAVVHGFKALGIDVGVDLGGGDVRVPKEFLNDAQIRPVAEQVRGARVPPDAFAPVREESVRFANSIVSDANGPRAEKSAARSAASGASNRAVRIGSVKRMECGSLGVMAA